MPTLVTARDNWAVCCVRICALCGGAWSAPVAPRPGLSGRLLAGLMPVIRDTSSVVRSVVIYTWVVSNIYILIKFRLLVSCPSEFPDPVPKGHTAQNLHPSPLPQPRYKTCHCPSISLHSLICCSLDYSEAESVFDRVCADNIHWQMPAPLNIAREFNEVIHYMGRLVLWLIETL